MLIPGSMDRGVTLFKSQAGEQILTDISAKRAARYAATEMSPNQIAQNDGARIVQTLAGKIAKRMMAGMPAAPNRSGNGVQ